jgi:membrane associated rhomboid family serine protease
MGPITKGVLGLFVGLSIINALAPAANIHLAEWTFLSPALVLRGEVWRLVTYPWIASDPIGLVFGALAVFLFGGRLEESWGSRLYFKRIAWFVLLPAVLVTVLGLGLQSVLRAQYFGLTPLLTALVVAFASQMRGRSIYMFPIPVPLSGDGLLYMEGGFLALYIIFARSVSPFMIHLLAFGLALAWFRFDLLRDVRRSWLRMKKRRIEAQMARVRASRNLRVVPSDDEDPPRFVH